MSLGRASAHPQALTPARWASWVSQPHEWSGMLWLRWDDAEATILYSRGRARVTLWSLEGWVEGLTALGVIGQRIERASPRWGQLPLLPDWAGTLSQLELAQPGMPVEVVRPQEWLVWAARQGFEGVALLLGETPAAWVVRGEEIIPFPFPAGGRIPDGRTLSGADGIFQVYVGTLPAALLAAETARQSVTWEQQRDGLAARPPAAPVSPVKPPYPPPHPAPLLAGPQQPWGPPPVDEPSAEPDVESSESLEESPASPEFVQDPLFSLHEAPRQEVGDQPVIYQMPSSPAETPTRVEPGAQRPPQRQPGPPGLRFSQRRQTPGMQGGIQKPPPSPPPVSYASGGPGLRFTGEECFMLSPSVNVHRPVQLQALLTQHGRELLGWLPMLDGTRTLEEVARQAGVAPRVVDEIVGRLVDQRLVFRYRGGRKV